MCEIGGLSFPIALKFGRHLSSTAAEVPAKFQSDTNVLTPDLVPLTLQDLMIRIFFLIAMCPIFLYTGFIFFMCSFGVIPRV